MTFPDTDPEDEKLIDELMAKRDSTRKVTSLHDVWLAGYWRGQDPDGRIGDNPYPARATPPAADHEPFAPMECCGRDRDKDGGPNPHCECPAPFKASPADEVAGLLGMLREVADEMVDHDCSFAARHKLSLVEQHLKGKC